MNENSHDDRRPTADPAEDNAFFPSPYSLSQYTAPRTNFDGLATEATYDGGRWKVLLVATEERYMLMENATMFSTGNHPVETLLPIFHVLEAGYEVVVATLSGGPAKFEWWAYPGEDDAVRSAWDRLRAQFKAPRKLDEVVDEFDADPDYAALFIPGGHGAMLGLPQAKSLQHALDWFLEHDRLIVTLCHGPAGLLAASLDRETSPFAGYRMCVFPDALDFGANLEIGYLPGPMPWKLGEALLRDGAVIENEDMTGATIRDRNLLTGDSPLAAHRLGQEFATALLDQFG